MSAHLLQKRFADSTVDLRDALLARGKQLGRISYAIWQAL
jgi:hypothetical protein